MVWKSHLLECFHSAQLHLQLHMFQMFLRLQICRSFNAETESNHQLEMTTRPTSSWSQSCMLLDSMFTRTWSSGIRAKAKVCFLVRSHVHTVCLLTHLSQVLRLNGRIFFIEKTRWLQPQPFDFSYQPAGLKLQQTDDQIPNCSSSALLAFQQ